MTFPMRLYAERIIIPQQIEQIQKAAIDYNAAADKYQHGVSAFLMEWTPARLGG